MPNRLIHETSPYLLQHAHNPVDWYPWGEEALARSRAEDKPILLSIGYSACHWCHVMEHESFENDETASIMNERFVSIKVDREERPDLDQIYMTAVQGMTHQGGWPMTVFLTPEGKPFFGGTYFPPTDRMGMPSFRRVLIAVSDMYRRERRQVEKQAERVADFIRRQALINAPAPSLDPSILDDAFNALAGQFDLAHGGFGGAPKFPQAMALEFLLRHHARTGNGASLQMVETTLQRMGHGGIYDQIGGGFHRYSVDERWLVPHFEKMLYDNALLARAYLHAHQLTGTPFYRRIVEETLDYVKRELRHEAGGFFSTQDADSEGVEGKYYVWTTREVEDAVGREDAPIVGSFYRVTEHGNFEGKNILTFPDDASAVASGHGLTPEQLDEIIARARARLLGARSQRVPPGRDEKVLAAWAGLMLRSFAESARALGRADDLATAEAAAAFLLREMWRDGQLLRVHKDGQTKIAGYLEDYGAVAAGLLALYEASFDLRWFVAAQEMAAAMVERFWDGDEGCFFDTDREAEPLVARPRDPWDNATPSGTSLACEALLRLWAYTGSSDYEGRARAALQGMGGLMRQQGTGLGNLLCALDFYLGPPREIAVIGNRDDPATAGLLAPLARAYTPNAVVAFAEPHDTEASAAIPLLAGRGLVDGKPAAYACTGFVCDLPSTTPEDLLAKLARPDTKP